MAGTERTTSSLRTLVVVITTSAWLVPAGTTRLAGRLATVRLLLASATVAPAAEVSSTVARTVWPPTTLVLASVTAVGVGGGAAVTFTTTGADTPTAPRLSVTVSLAL